MFTKDVRHEEVNRVILVVGELESDTTLVRLMKSGVTSEIVRAEPRIICG